MGCFCPLGFIRNLSWRMYKLVQKQIYDFLNLKCGVVAVCICCLFVISASAIYYAEVLLLWSKLKYSSGLVVTDPLRDNLSGSSYQSQMCQHLPVDVVYTWVNGSDPLFLEQLRREISLSSTGPTSSKLDSSSIDDCPFEICLESPIVIVSPALPLETTLNDLRFASASALFAMAKKIATNFTTLVHSEEFTLVYFDSVYSARNFVERGFFSWRGANHTIRPGYVTSEWMSSDTLLLDDILILSDLPLQVTREEILEKIPFENRSLISEIFMFSLKRVVVIVAVSKPALESLLSLEGSLTLAGREPTFSVANLVLRNPTDSAIFLDNVGRNRFQDNEELRYSLRSLEKNAPWVRHVYVVTNGQIPSWLDLDNPRVSLITHEELFTDLSHLPTFSSPAIESHLHRIIGLSKRFLYLNDDVLFGKPIWPEDFYTFARGQKVYLAWQVPDCSYGCPSGWIADGYCDKPCNNSDCQWDGDDCTNAAIAAHSLDGASHDLDFDEWQESLQSLYCLSNCATLWIGDKYCDPSCNVIECAYDGGDCGVDNHDDMLEIRLKENIQMYSMPIGVSAAYFNLSDFLGSKGIVNRSLYEVLEGPSNSLRAVAFNQKFKIMTLLLSSRSATFKVRFTISGSKRNGHHFEFQFTLVVGSESRTKPLKKQPRFIKKKLSDIWKSAKFNALSPRPSTKKSVRGKDRRLLDTFGDSLRHANRLLNTEFGYEARRVPAHMFDRDIVAQLELRFVDAFEATSSHRLRNPQDLQLAFAYFYFLMSERRPYDLDQVFEQFDTDRSGTLSDREIRTLLTRFYGLPITFKVTKRFEEIVTNCSSLLPPEFGSDVTASQYERYLDSKMPVVTKNLVANCDPLLQLFRDKTKNDKRFAYEIVGEEEVAFKMISTNVTQVLTQLDDIRARPRKFVCLNDNIDHGLAESWIVKQVLRDFYESMFPLRSQFELPSVYRNRFLHVKELKEWRTSISRLRFLTYISICLLILFTIIFLLDSKMVRAWKRSFCRIVNHRRTRTTTTV